MACNTQYLNTGADDFLARAPLLNSEQVECRVCAFSKTTLWLVGGETQLTEWADSSSLKGVSVAIFPYTTRDPEAVRGVADADRRRLSAWIQQEVPQARTKVGLHGVCVSSR